jgi:hypothetical protein
MENWQQSLIESNFYDYKLLYAFVAIVIADGKQLYHPQMLRMRMRKNRKLESIY